MKFVITGGSGFLGSNLAKKLLEENNDVTIFDDISQRDTDRSNGNKIYHKFIDFENVIELKKELKGFDVVVHFMASANTRIGKLERFVLQFFLF